MKPITKTEAKAFDRRTFNHTRTQEAMDIIMETINDRIKLSWEDLEKGKTILIETKLHWDTLKLHEQIKHMYQEEGYEMSFSNQYAIVSIKLIN